MPFPQPSPLSGIRCFGLAFTGLLLSYGSANAVDDPVSAAKEADQRYAGLQTTSVRPGRVNVWGTILAVAVLAVTVAGLNQLGAPFFVEPIFDGAMLILAVGLAVTATRRRSKLSGTAAGVPGASSALPTNE